MKSSFLIILALIAIGGLALGLAGFVLKLSFAMLALLIGAIAGALAVALFMGARAQRK